LDDQPQTGPPKMGGESRGAGEINAQMPKYLRQPKICIRMEYGKHWRKSE